MTNIPNVLRDIKEKISNCRDGRSFYRYEGRIYAFNDSAERASHSKRIEEKVKRVGEKITYEEWAAEFGK